MSRFVKEPATIEAQLAKLETRGCLIEDRPYAMSVLEKINYYRLANYFAVFHDDRKFYRRGTSFNSVIHLYDFDRRLRGQLLIFLEEIEISMRAVISNYHALKYGALGYHNEASFSHSHNHNRFISKIERLIESNTDVGFVSHHNKKYSGAFPLWVIMELFSFGMLAFFFDDMQTGDQKEISDRCFGGFISARHIGSWLECLAALRNHCAHYCRIYANTIEPSPKPLESAPFKMDGNVFSFIYIMRLLDRYLFGGETIAASLAALIEEYEDVVDLKTMGFPENWEEILA